MRVLDNLVVQLLTKSLLWHFRAASDPVCQLSKFWKMSGLPKLFGDPGAAVITQETTLGAQLPFEPAHIEPTNPDGMSAPAFGAKR
jgi:hypothetical protein